MLEQLKEEVLNANLELVKKDLVIYTWGNVSGISRPDDLVIIKPSGVTYEELTADKMVVVDIKGNIIEGKLNPSSDTATHLVLYNSFKDIGGIVHTHSTYASSWAQACLDIPCYGTTHADYFYQEIPCTRIMTIDEVKNKYEENTGKVIVERFRNKDYNCCPAVLVAGHGPFTWGKNPEEAVSNSVVLEEVAKIAFNTMLLNPLNNGCPYYLLDKHFFRKHGKNAYYGQKNKK